MAAVEGKPEEGSCYLDRGFDLSGHLRFKDQLVYILAMSRQTPVQLPRGRPRSFDVEAAVERAMGVFWSRGYHATALPDLLRATKLSRGSLTPLSVTSTRSSCVRLIATLPML